MAGILSVGRVIRNWRLTNYVGVYIFLSPLAHELAPLPRPRSLYRSFSSPSLPSLDLHHVPTPAVLLPGEALARSRFRLVGGTPHLSRALAIVQQQLNPIAGGPGNYTLRHYSTLRLCKARPQTHNRYSHRPVYPMREWDDILSHALDRISQVTRSFRNYRSVWPETRYLLTPTHSYNVVTRLNYSYPHYF